ncbi:hypothetical protein [uncultured Oscillibacter sp.]|uniref:hypothetical protein n=1 Tax=uncultured Oscillibacter sp. TaxID=876091 RepID=UPI0025CE5B4C|nr:hypothetical protein [uncultured Oscillibacter sp.]
MIFVVLLLSTFAAEFHVIFNVMPWHCRSLSEMTQADRERFRRGLQITCTCIVIWLVIFSVLMIPYL